MVVPRGTRHASGTTVLALLCALLVGTSPVVAAHGLGPLPGGDEGPSQTWNDAGTPGTEEPPIFDWWTEWLRWNDRDGNLVDDRADRLADEALAEGDGDRPVEVKVSYDRFPDELDIVVLEALHGASLVYRFEYIPTFMVDVPARHVRSLGDVDGVVAVEWRAPAYPINDVAAPATQSRDWIGSGGNTVYNGQTAQSLGYTGTGMVVAVMDTGVTDSHPAFAGKWIGGANFGTANTGCTNPADNDGHGTHVAGSVLGNQGGNNHKGTAMDAKLVEIRISDNSGNGVGISQGWDWVLKYNAGTSCYGNVGPDRIDVVTLSFGTLGPGGSNAGSDESLIRQLTQSGVVVTIAAGNCGPGSNVLNCPLGFGDEQTVSSPGNAEAAISVANSNDGGTVTRANDAIHGSSSRGPVQNAGSSGSAITDRNRKPELAAPGTGITSASSSGSGYVTYTGTSMATPLLAGAAALLLQAGEEAKAQTGGVNLMRPTGSGYLANGAHDAGKHPVRDALVQSADYKTAGVTSAQVSKWQSSGMGGATWNNGYGYGHIDTFAALCWAWENVLMPGGASPSSTVATKCDLAVVADAGGPYSGDYGTQITLLGSATGGMPPYTFDWDLDGDGAYDDATGATPGVTFEFPGEYVAALRVTDDLGAQAFDAATVIVTDPQAIVASAGGPYSGDMGTPIALSASASGGDGTLAYAWDLDGDGVFDDAFGTSTSVTFATPGTKTVAVRVTDETPFRSTVATALVSVIDPDNPVVATAGGPYSGTLHGAITLAASASGGDSPYTYEWDIDEDGVYELSGSSATAHYGSPGTYPILLRVTDNSGREATAQASVTVTDPDPGTAILTNGVASSYPYSAGSWLHKRIYVPAGTGSFSVSMTGPTCSGIPTCSPDGDLYVRRGSPPTSDTYDCRPFVNGNSESCSFTNPASGWWYVSVNGFSGSATNTITASHNGNGGDSTPPSQVTGLSVTDATTGGRLDLSWNAATDTGGSGVDHYRVYRDGAFVAATTATAFSDTGLSNGQTYTYRVAARDGLVNEGPLSAAVSGTPTVANVPPVLAPIGPKQVDEGNLLAFTLVATDEDDPDEDLVFSVIDLPPGAFFDADTFTWTPSFTQAGTYTPTFQVTDGHSTVGETVTITVVDVNRPVTLLSPGDHALPEGETLSFTLTFLDEDTDNEHTFGATGLPAGATLGTTSGVFAWTPDFDQAGHYTVTFHVDDNAGSTDSKASTITVWDVNRPPVLDPIGDRDANVGDELAFTVTASDPDGDVVTLTAQDLPADASWDPASGAFSWTPGVAHLDGVFTVTFGASDGDLEDTQPVAITVVDTGAPTQVADFDADGDDEGIQLTWSAASDNVGVVAYQIERASALSNGQYQALATTAGDVLAFHDDTATPGIPHDYRLRAADAAWNQGGWSATRTASWPTPTVCEAGDCPEPPTQRSWGLKIAGADPLGGALVAEGPGAGTWSWSLFVPRQLRFDTGAPVEMTTSFTGPWILTIPGRCETSVGAGVPRPEVSLGVWDGTSFASAATALLDVDQDGTCEPVITLHPLGPLVVPAGASLAVELGNGGGAAPRVIDFDESRITAPHLVDSDDDGVPDLLDRCPGQDDLDPANIPDCQATQPPGTVVVTPRDEPYPFAIADGEVRHYQVTPAEGGLLVFWAETSCAPSPVAQAPCPHDFRLQMSQDPSPGAADLCTSETLAHKNEVCARPVSAGETYYYTITGTRLAGDGFFLLAMVDEG